MKLLRSSLLFPLSLAVILGGLSVWLGEVSEIRTEETALPPNEPQYLMQNTSGIRFNEHGQLQEKLTAQSVWQLPDQKHVFFRQPELYVWRDKGYSYRVRAQQAAAEVENRTIVFEHGVVLQQNGSSPQNSGEIRTERLNVDSRKQTAQTDAAVSFRFGQSEGSANGLYYEHQTGKLILPSKVKALIYAAQKS